MPEQCPLGELEKILLATDGSESCEGAVREAIGLAGRCASQMTVMLVIESFQRFASLAPNVLGAMAAAAQEQEKEGHKYLESIRARAEAAGIDCEIVIKEGDPFGSIIDEAKKRGSELIVMGRRGRSRLARMAMGSVTAKVIGNMPGDVLVVPKDATMECKNILAATDGSRDGDTAVEAAFKMARKCGSRLQVLSVAASEARQAEVEEALSKARELAAAEGMEIETLTALGKPYVQIIKTANEQGSDLIVVGRHGRGTLERLLMGSVTERVVGHASCAVLVSQSF